MPNELYTSLFDANAPHEGPDELVAAFARIGRIRRAAMDLANDEMHEGLWAIEDASEPQAVRYAADDRDETTATYTGEDYVVTLRRDRAVWTATQEQGTPGASLKIGSEWIVLQLGRATALPLDSLPDGLTLVDLSGREIPLSR